MSSIPLLQGDWGCLVDKLTDGRLWRGMVFPGNEGLGFVFPKLGNWKRSSAAASSTGATIFSKLKMR